MPLFSSGQTAILILDLAILLGLARLLGEVAGRLKLPPVVGEVAAGIVLGPTIMGNLSPDLFEALFPLQGSVGVALETIRTLSVIFLLMVAGMEIDLGSVLTRGKEATVISFMGVFSPFILGFGAAWLTPSFWGLEAEHHRLSMALFIGAALSISALPVIAKILMDLKIYKSDLGVIIMTSAMINDLAGWTIFSVVMGAMTGGAAAVGIIPRTLIFLVAFLTAVRWFIDRMFPVVQSRLSWPGGEVTFVLVVVMLGAAVAEYLGIHAVFGGFFAGIAVGSSRHFHNRTRQIINQFVMNFFSPFFFAFIGLSVDFAANFSLPLVGSVLGLSYLGKVGGSFFGARLVGLGKRESMTVGVGMSAQGAMGIIFGTVALGYGIIGPSLFTSLVLMALVTSVVSGPVVKSLIPRREEWTLARLLEPSFFIPTLNSRSRFRVLYELSKPAALALGIPVSTLARDLCRREMVISSAIGEGIAVPHLRLQDLKAPVLVAGRSPEGVDFKSPDNRPVHLFFLLLTPTADDGAQLEIMADIARSMQNENIRNQAMVAETFSEFAAQLKIASTLSQKP